ncbi:MAG: hypothetical protein ACJAZN_002582 [Planctomycetota bacterium]|jgi:hypothetical protein
MPSTSAFVLTLALWLTTACSPPDPLRTDFDDSPDGLSTGQFVRVVLRSDASAATRSLSGPLVAITDEWVALKVNGETSWIQRVGILLIAEDKPKVKPE